MLLPSLDQGKESDWKLVSIFIIFRSKRDAWNCYILFLNTQSEEKIWPFVDWQGGGIFLGAGNASRGMGWLVTQPASLYFYLICWLLSVMLTSGNTMKSFQVFLSGWNKSSTSEVFQDSKQPLKLFCGPCHNTAAVPRLPVDLLGCRHTFYKVSIIQQRVETNRANILQIWHEIERLATSSELGKISNFSGILNSQYCPSTPGDDGCPWVRLTINFIGEFPLI